jgi:hypothetical protein
MTTTTAHAARAARVAAAVENYLGRDACEDGIEHANKDVDAAAHARSAASAAVRALPEGDPQYPIATARYQAARARFEAARAAVQMAEATRNKLRAVAEAFAWDDEADTIAQGNPHDPHTPQSAAWAAGYGHAERGQDFMYHRPEAARATFGDCAGQYRDGYEAATQQPAPAQGGQAAEAADLEDDDWRAEALKSRVEAILGDDFTVAVNPHSDFPSVEIDTVLGGAIEFVGFDPETGKYQATQWVVGPCGEGREDTAFDTLTAAVEHARKGTTREE